MNDDPDEGARREVETQVAAAEPSALAPWRIDEIVLTAGGCGDRIVDLFAAAHDARDQALRDRRARRRAWFGVRSNPGPASWMAVAALITGAAAGGGIFGRAGQSPGWTWLVAGGSVVSGLLVVAVVLLAGGRPLDRHVARILAAAVVVYGAATAVIQLFPDLPGWERGASLGATLVGVLALVVLHRTRRARPAAALEIDLAELHERRALRERFAAELPGMVDELDRRLVAMGSDRTRLGRLWDHARVCVERRGVLGLERPPGPVGASVIGVIMDLPRSQVDEDLERLEAKRRSLTEDR